MNATPSFMEHRWGRRVHLDSPAHIVTSTGRSARVALKNASLSGAFLETRVKLPLLSCVTVLPLEQHTGHAIQAFVVRSDQSGIGVEWLEPGPDTLRSAIGMEHARAREAMTDTSTHG